MKTPKIEKLPSGSYRIRVTVDGKTMSITRSSASECKAAAALIKAQAMNDMKISSDPKSRTLRIACDRYINERSAVLSPSTIRGYDLIVRNRFASVMDLPLKSVSNWQRVINEEAATVSAKTLKNAWGFIKSVLANEGVEVPKVRLPQVESKDMPWLNYDEIQALVASIEGTPIELACLLALNGLRRSELFALTKSSIDGDSLEIRVRGARVEGPDGYVSKKTNKNSSSTRNVPILFPRIIDLANMIPDGAPLMTYSEKHLCGHINKACRTAGVPEVGTHGCRRSFASWCAHERIPEDVCMSWGGWSDMYTMRKIYTKYSDKDKQNYAEQMRNKIQN